MGILEPVCIATDGVRVYALSFAYDDDPGRVYTRESTTPYAVLAQSNAYPDFLNTRPAGTSLTKEHIHSAMVWKVVNVAHEKQSRSWFRTNWSRSGTPPYNCGVTSSGNPDNADDYVFVLHVTDTAYRSAEPESMRRLAVVKFRLNQELEVRFDERPPIFESIELGPQLEKSDQDTIAGVIDLRRSVLVPLNKDALGRGDGNGPWTEAMTDSFPRNLIQISTTKPDTGAFPYLVQSFRPMNRTRFDALALDDKKLYAWSKTSNCSLLWTMETRIQNDALVLVETPAAAITPRPMCFPAKDESILHRETVGIAVSRNGTVYALNVDHLDHPKGLAVGETPRLEFDLYQHNPDMTGSALTVLGTDIYLDGGYHSILEWNDMLAVLPLARPGHLSSNPGQPDEMSFLTGTLGSMVLISRQSADSQAYTSTLFNITVPEPYTFYQVRRTGLTAAEIGGITAGGVAGLLLIVWGVRKYLQRRNRNKDQQDVVEIGIDYKLEHLPSTASSSSLPLSLAPPFKAPKV